MHISPRSLFIVVVRIFGLFFLKEIITQIPYTVSSTISYFSFASSETYNTLSVLIVSLLALAFYVFLAVGLIFQAEKIVDRLKLDKGFSEEHFSFETNTNKQVALPMADILQIALIVIAGVILIFEIPEFCRQIYNLINENKYLPNGAAQKSIANCIMSVAKVLIALLLLGERQSIIKFMLNTKSNKTAENN
jgi:hypothetical protein